MTPFRVKVHEENVPYAIRRIEISVTRVDFTIMHDRIMEHVYSQHKGYQGWVYMSEEKAVTKGMAKGLRRAALKNGKDVITILEQHGDVIEYLDEPGLEGKKIITPHVFDREKCFFGLKKGDEVRRGDIWYVGYPDKNEVSE